MKHKKNFIDDMIEFFSSISGKKRPSDELAKSSGSTANVIRKKRNKRDNKLKDIMKQVKS